MDEINSLADRETIMIERGIIDGRRKYERF